MSYENDFDEILKTINKRDSEEKTQEQEVPKADENEPLVPMKETTPEVKPEEEKAEESEKNEKKLIVSLEPPEAIKGFGKKLSQFGFKKIAIIAAAIVVLIVGIFAGIKIADYAKVAYIRDYEKKYQVDFPDGIEKKFCDEYGKDQSFVGTLTSKEAKLEKVKVFSKYRMGDALLEKGSDIFHAQHIRAISLDEGVGDIEGAYSTPEAFLSSSQKVVFETLFGDEEYQVVAAYYTNTNPDDDDGYVFPYNTYGNLTEKSFYHFQDRIKNRRLYDTGYKLLEQNYVLSISAPSDFMKDFRFVIVCVKADDGFEKSTKAEPNAKIHYPQIWYDTNNQKNPFWLSGDWYPEIVVDSNGKTKQLTRKDFEE